ncbi:MAG: hypothetical protein MUF61_01535, partial [archaeon]|nr:hypothetical protein [archaeon]
GGCGEEVYYNEECDGDSRACLDWDGYDGTQTCIPDCSGYDECSSDEYCGDGMINGPENCDGDSNPCTTEDGYDGWEECTEYCDGFGECDSDEYCGDFAINGPEICEYGDSQSCVDPEHGYNGEQTCNSECNEWDTCYPYESCGDDIINGYEQCDGDTRACVDSEHGYNGYEECDELCGWDLSYCEYTEYCGDEIINGDEVCDGDMEPCTIGGYTGMRICNSECSGFGTCVANQSCGDGIINGEEECDDSGALTPASCGVGECADSIADSCVSCLNVTCTPGLPVDEDCNNKDDDCDASTDENLSQTCYSGPSGTKDRGRCQGGTQTCSAGTWGTCIGEITSVGEVCGNSIDDDCDGTIDNGCGGGGGGHGPVVIILKDEIFEAGFQKQAAVNSQFKFNVAGGVHTLKITSIRADGIQEVTVLISSEPIKVTLKVGDKKEVDVNGDGKADVLVELLGIIGDLADLRITPVVEKAAVETPSNETPVVEAEKPSIFSSTATTEEKTTGILLVAVAIIFAVIALIVELRSRSKKSTAKRVKVRRKAVGRKIKRKKK